MFDFSLLAQAAEQVTENGEQAREWFQNLLNLLPLFIAAAVVIIWHRQKTIAANQVKIARLLQELLERQRK